MSEGLREYVQTRAGAWLGLRGSARLVPMIRVNRQARAPVLMDSIGTVLFWFSDENDVPVLVSKILSESNSVEFVRRSVAKQAEVNEAIGFKLFPKVFDVAHLTDGPVVFMEWVGGSTYEMELSHAVFGPAANVIRLKRAMASQLAEVRWLLGELRRIEVGAERRRPGGWVHDAARAFCAWVDPPGELLSKSLIESVARRVDSLNLRVHYKLSDFHCGNFLPGPRLVDQIDQTTVRRRAGEPGIFDLFRFLVAYFRASPVSSVYRDWVRLIGCLMAGEGEDLCDTAVRGMIEDAGLALADAWRLLLVSILLRGIDELEFHRGDETEVSKLRTELIAIIRSWLKVEAELADRGRPDARAVRDAEAAFEAPSRRASDDVFPVPHLVEEGCNGFNIIRCGPRFYALAQDEGSFDLGKALRGEYRRVYSANSVEEVKQQLKRRDAARSVGEVRQGIRVERVLSQIEECVGELRRVTNAMAEISTRLGNLALRDAEGAPDSKCTAESLLRDSLHDSNVQPLLVEEGCGEFNIIQYGSRFYALAQEEGAFDIDKVVRGEYRRCYVADSAEGARRLARAASALSAGRGARELGAIGLADGEPTREPR